MPIAEDWAVPGESFGGGGMGVITGEHFGGSAFEPDAAEIVDKILNGNGNGDGMPSSSPLGFASSAGGAFILGLVILAMSGFRG